MIGFSVKDRNAPTHGRAEMARRSMRILFEQQLSLKSLTPGKTRTLSLREDVTAEKVLGMTVAVDKEIPDGIVVMISGEEVVVMTDVTIEEMTETERMIEEMTDEMIEVGETVGMTSPSKF